MAESGQATFRLEVVTPQRVLLSADVEELVAPGTEGYFGVLPGRAPFITTLQAGELIYWKGGKEHRLAVTWGYAEVRGDQVRILAKAAEGAEEIDVARADRARQRAEKRLQDWMNGDEAVDYARALGSLQRAMARLAVARKGE